RPKVGRAPRCFRHEGGEGQPPQASRFQRVPGQLRLRGKVAGAESSKTQPRPPRYTQAHPTPRTELPCPTRPRQSRYFHRPPGRTTLVHFGPLLVSARPPVGAARAGKNSGEG